MLKITSWISWIAFAASCGALSGSLTRAAFADETSQASASETEVSVTQARVAQLTRALNEREAQVDPATISRDFASARAEFLRKIREGMPRFEQEVAGIIGRLEPLKDRMRAIQISTAYDDAQKASLIRLIENEAASLYFTMQDDYLWAIRRAYTLPGGAIPFDYRVSPWEIKQKRLFRCRWHIRQVTLFSPEETSVSNLRYRHGGETDRRYDRAGLHDLDSSLLDWAISQERIHDRVVSAVTQGCQTRTCMSLMLEEWRKYTQMVNTTLDQPINAGLGVTLHKTQINSTTLGLFLNVSDRWEHDMSIPFSN